MHAANILQYMTNLFLLITNICFVSIARFVVLDHADVYVSIEIHSMRTSSRRNKTAMFLF